MKNIENILSRIIALLKENKQQEWEKIFNFFLTNIVKYGESSVKKSISSVYAGMGSFNDLVIYNDGKLNYKANMELDILRRELFDKIK